MARRLAPFGPLIRLLAAIGTLSSLVLLGLLNLIP